MDQSPRKHHRKSLRLQGYNYARLGLYFVTICSHKHQCIFGHIEQGKMNLNELGNWTTQCWLEIPKHFPHAVLHDHIIMPNHVHGIIEINQDVNAPVKNHSLVHVEAKKFSPLQNSVKLFKHLQFTQNTRLHFNWEKTAFKSPSKTIGSIIRGFKIGVTNWYRYGNNKMPTVNINGKTLPVWQRNYHDHIIRNYAAYEKISDYILNNPSRWMEDKFYTA